MLFIIDKVKIHMNNSSMRVSAQITRRGEILNVSFSHQQRQLFAEIPAA